MKRTLSLSIFLILYLTSSAQLYQEYLLSDWTFKSTASKYWLPAEVPGTSVDDLLLNGKTSIKTADTAWQYRTTFIADKQVMSRDFVELLFEGLDTRATVYLNQEQILVADNMFRSWSVPIKPFLKEGENELLIEFEADDYEPSLRKAFYHFDSNISIVPVGVWRPVILESWNGYKLDGVSYNVDRIVDKEAHITASVDFIISQEMSVDIEIFDEISGRTFVREKAVIDPTGKQINIPFVIKKPKLWWPKSLGKPNLYKIGIRTKAGNNEQTLAKRIGIRTIEIDSLSNREHVTATVNGKRVVAKKSDYIPFVLNVSSQSAADYEGVFNIVESLGSTMIHILNTGVYESDYFYDLADVAGMLIFQDFMFPAAAYPKSENFLENVKEEAEENVKSLQHHPSIVVWGGVPYESGNDKESTMQMNQVLEETLKETSSSYKLITE